MSTYVRTVHTTMNAADTVTAAETIAANLREQGMTADVGKVYDDVTIRYYGMPAVDITVTESDVPLAEEPTPESPADDTPAPMPVAELGGSPTVTVEPETAPDTAEPETAAVEDSPAAATPATEDSEVDTETDISSPDTTEEPVNTGDTAPTEGTAGGTPEGEAY